MIINTAGISTVFQRIKITHFVIAEAICCHMDLNLNTAIKYGGIYPWRVSKRLQTGVLPTYVMEEALLEIVKTEPSVECNSG